MGCGDICPRCIAEIRGNVVEAVFDLIVVPADIGDIVRAVLKLHPPMEEPLEGSVHTQLEGGVGDDDPVFGVSTNQPVACEVACAKAQAHPQAPAILPSNVPADPVLCARIRLNNGRLYVPGLYPL